MKTKVIKNETYNIHILKNNQFKKVEIKVYFKNNFIKEEGYLNTFLFELLTESTAKYPSLRELLIRYEELYNLKVSGATYRSGLAIYNSLSISFIDPKYIKEKDYLNNVFELFFSIIFNPDIKNDKFDENKISIIKQRIINIVNSNRENPMYNLGVNSIKAMDPNSPIATEVYGTPEQIESITNEELIRLYKNIIEHSYIDIYIAGDIDENKYIDLVNNYASFKTIKNHEVPLYVKNKKKYIVTKGKEFTKYNQSHIALIYTLDNLTSFERKYTMNIFDIILGGGFLETKLSRIIREKLSLCYSISSSYTPLDNTLAIYTSVDNNKINETIKAIKKTFKEMKNNISESELKNAINGILINLNDQATTLNNIISSNHYKDEANLDDMEERIKKYKSVTIEDIYKVFNKIKLNTIYVLEGSCNEEN